MSVLPILPLRNFNSDQLRSTIVAAFCILAEREEMPLEEVIQECYDACAAPEPPALDQAD